MARTSPGSPPGRASRRSWRSPRRSSRGPRRRGSPSSTRTARRPTSMFLEDLADLKDRYPTRLALHHVLSREQRSAPLLSGRIDEPRLRRILDALVLPETVDEWFLCGPFELVQLCRDTLDDIGVDAAHVRYELFTTGEGGRPEGLGGTPGRGASGRAGPPHRVHPRRPVVDGRQPGVGARVDPQRRAAGAPRRAVRLRGRSVRHVPCAAGRGLRLDDAELRARTRRARARLRPDLPIPPHDASRVVVDYDV